MAYIMVDVEANGPVPGIDMFSMIEIGAVVVEPGLKRTFWGQLRPISGRYDLAALNAIGMNHYQTLKFPAPELTMQKLEKWLGSLDEPRLTFISDNNGFDWQFFNYYCHKFLGGNPLGFSSQNLGSLTKGLDRDLTSWRHKSLRRTPHTHNSLDDAKGNAEALLSLAAEFGLKLQ